MKTYISLNSSHEKDLPDNFRGDDVRFSQSLVEYFLKEYTNPGDIVFDPFAGYGTTLVVSERLGRIPFGVENIAEKVDYARSLLKNPGNLLISDSRYLSTLGLPIIDFTITSPPYMNQEDEEDPFTGYKENGKGYPAYLENIQKIFLQLKVLMKTSGKVVIEIANIKKNGNVTTLAWDVAREISKIFHFDGEVIVCWDKYGYGYDHSYCLVYSVK
jgi:DNA modification methylase